MDKSELLRRAMLRSVLVFLLLALSGCALVLPEAAPPAPTTTPEPEAAPEPAPPVEAQPVVKPAPVVESPPKPEPVSARVAIVLTDSLPAYKNVATELTAYLDDYSIYDLADRNRTPRSSRRTRRPDVSLRSGSRATHGPGAGSPCANSPLGLRLLPWP